MHVLARDLVVLRAGVDAVCGDRVHGDGVDRILVEGLLKLAEISIVTYWCSQSITPSKIVQVLYLRLFYHHFAKMDILFSFFTKNLSGCATKTRWSAQK